MRSLVIGLAAIAMPLVAISDTADGDVVGELSMPTLPVWQPSGGETIAFEVLRKGKPFGTHVVSFDKLDDGKIEVVNDIDLQVKFGPITAYNYSHDSTELWDDGRLIELNGQTRKERQDLEVSATAGTDVLNVDGTNYTGTVAADVIPSSHWHSGEVLADAIFSSEGGQMLEIEVDDLGTEMVSVNGQDVEATRFRLYSDITFDLWYDAEGRWVKCAFEARGQAIEYVLQALY